MEAITVSAGERVSGWAQALLGEAGNSRGIKQPHRQPASFWEDLCVRSLQL